MTMTMIAVVLMYAVLVAPGEILTCLTKHLLSRYGARSYAFRGGVRLIDSSAYRPLSASFAVRLFTVANGIVYVQKTDTLGFRVRLRLIVPFYIGN